MTDNTGECKCCEQHAATIERLKAELAEANKRADALQHDLDQTYAAYDALRTRCHALREMIIG